MAGNLTVAANYDLRTRQPYWVIELAAGRDSAVVTAGKAAARRFSFLRQSSAPFIEDVLPIVALMEELEAIFPDNAIEIEFGLTEESPILSNAARRPSIREELRMRHSRGACPRRAWPPRRCAVRPRCAS
jgi:hypothetical protein